MCSVVKFASLSIELRLCRSSLISRRLLPICSKYVTLSVPTYDRYLPKGISWGFDSAGGPRTKTAILLMRINEIFNESDGQTAKVN